MTGRITVPKDSHVLTSEVYGCEAWYGEGDFVDVDFSLGDLHWLLVLGFKKVDLCYL